MKYNIDVVVSSKYYFETIEADSEDEAKEIALGMIERGAVFCRREDIDFDVYGIE